MKTEEIYFTSENDAEAALAELERLKISNVRLEEVPHGEPLNKKPFIPLSPGFTGPTGLEASPLKNKDRLEKERAETVTHLLRFDVDERDHEKAVAILGKVDCYRKNPEEE